MPVHQMNNSPDFVPILSVGRHRTPRRGGCFMEFASYLAGEKWSDHPACTHPTLALLARLVNDATSDAERPALAELIPSVIGLTSSDPRVDLRIALRAATVALPIASEGRQQALAVGIIAAQSHLARREPLADSTLTDDVASAFAQAPLAESWARAFIAENGLEHRDRALRRMTESLIHTAVMGIANACAPGSDACLRSLLRDAIQDCRMIVDITTVDTASAAPTLNALRS